MNSKKDLSRPRKMRLCGAFLILLTSGCATMNVRSVGRDNTAEVIARNEIPVGSVYPAVYTDGQTLWQAVRAVRHPDEGLWAVIFLVPLGLADLPFSIVSDTLLLPRDLVHKGDSLNVEYVDQNTRQMKKAEVFNRHGERNGKCDYFFYGSDNSGEIHLIIDYKNGKRQGNARTYLNDKIIANGSYLNDQPVDGVFHDADGFPGHLSQYRHGDFISREVAPNR